MSENFKNMSADECALSLAVIEDEIEKRKAYPIYNYNRGGAVHKKQLAFHKCLKRNRWVFGGNRSGKTECGAVEAVYMAARTFSAGWCRSRARFRGTSRRVKF